MAHYDYTALEAATGTVVQGRVEAPDAPAAAASLRERALLPTELKPAANDTRALSRRGPSRLAITRTRDVVFFLRELALMLRAGLTLLSALEAARESCPRPKLARSIGRIRESVASGRTLSQAFALERPLFPDVAARLVASAEASGELDATLDRVAAHVDRGLELRNALLGSLVYPFVLALAALGIATFLVVKVIPTFAKFLGKRHVALPWAARALMDACALLRAHGLAVALGVAVAGLGLALLRRSTAGRRASDRALLFVPVLGGALTAAAMAQVSQTLALLLRGGVSLLEALRLAATVAGNAAVAGVIERAAEGVLRGSDLASGLDRPEIPRLLVQVVATGERTGALDHVLGEIGGFYEAELRARLKQILALFEPCVILVVGGLVGFVYFAFFQALLSLAARGQGA